MAGNGSNVEMAGAPVSPLGSPLKPDDFRRGRDITVACESKLVVASFGMLEEFDGSGKSDQWVQGNTS